VRLALSGGAGPRGELGPLPLAGNYQYQSAQIPLRYHYGVIQLTGQVMNLTKGDKNAFAEALSITMDGRQ